jgi:hypothetical protein
MPREPLIGDRVRLIMPVDNSPDFYCEAGEEGTFTNIDDDNSYWIRLDKHHPDLDPWHNELLIWDWSAEDENNAHPKDYLEVIEKAFILVEIHYPDGNSGCLHLDLEPNLIMVGERWRPGVVATANALDHYGEEIAYAINEGGAVEGDFDDGVGDEDIPVRWTVCQQSLDLLAKHGLIENPWTVQTPKEET